MSERLFVVTRVLLDFRIDEGGVGRYGRDLTRGLAELNDGLKAEVVHGDRGLGRLTKQPFTPWGRRSVARRAEQARADLIHGLHLELPESPLPMVVTIQDLRPLDFPDQMRAHRRLPLQWIVRDSMQRADKIIVPSLLTAESVLRHGGQAAADKVMLIPLGVSGAFTPLSPDETEQARQKFGSGRPYIAGVFHHHFRPHKNFPAFVEVAKALALKRPEIGFIAAGVPADQCPASVTALGRLTDDDLRLFYGGAELFFLPSKTEGFGYPVVESLLCGTPVVCAPSVGVLRWIDEGAYIADVGDAAGCAGTIAELLADPDELTVAAEEGRRQASTLTIDKMAKETAEVYQALCS